MQAMLLGVGVGGVTPVTNALIADLSSARRLGAAMGVFGTIWDIGEAAGSQQFASGRNGFFSGGRILLIAQNFTQQNRYPQQVALALSSRPDMIFEKDRCCSGKSMAGPNSLLKKVFEVSLWATLIQDPSARRTKDSQPSAFGFEYCASHVRFRVFQQTAKRVHQSALRSASGGRNDASKTSLDFGIVDLNV